MDRCSVGPGHSVEAWQRQHQSAQRLSKVLLGNKRTALSVYRINGRLLYQYMYVYIYLLFLLFYVKKFKKIFFLKEQDLMILVH